jgi:hypothetical protein
MPVEDDQSFMARVGEGEGWALELGKLDRE